MALQVKTFKLKLADAGGTQLQPGEFIGHASIHTSTDQGGDRVKRGAFARTVKAQGGKVPLLWQHDTQEPIGVSLSLEEDEVGLKVHGQINLEVQRGAECYALLKQGAIRGLSFGYDVVRSSPGTNGAYRNLEELKLYEISPVTFPMHLEAGVERVKALMQDGAKYVDFTTTDDRSALYQARYRMADSLSSALYSIMGESDREAEERLALAAESLDQHKAAMLAWCALYMEAMAGEKGGASPEESKGLRSAEWVAKVQEATKALQALLASTDSGLAHSKEATTPAPATPEAPADTAELEQLVAEMKRDAEARRTTVR